MAMTNAEKKRAQRVRDVKKSREALTAQTPKAQALFDLIDQATTLAAEINADLIAELEAKPLTRDTARELDGLDGRFMRISMPNVGLI